jgi:hypothetical protein
VDLAGLERLNETKLERLEAELRAEGQHKRDLCLALQLEIADRERDLGTEAEELQLARQQLEMLRE